MKKYFLLVHAVLLLNLVYGQKQANIWHFGGEFGNYLAPANGICIDFSNGFPEEVFGSEMRGCEGTASYCDSLGNLLFYTNGGGREVNYSGQASGTIWNKNNGVLYEMNGVEGGGWSSNQSSVIFEAPNEQNVYYLFTMDEGEFDIGASPITLASQPTG